MTRHDSMHRPASAQLTLDRARRLRRLVVRWMTVCTCFVSAWPAAAQGAGGLVVPGQMIIPQTGVCSDFQALYSNPSITDNGDGIYSTVSSYPGIIAYGYLPNANPGYTAVIYNQTALPPGDCWRATVVILEGDPGTPAHTDTCYSTAACALQFGPVIVPKEIERAKPPAAVALPTPTNLVGDTTVTSAPQVPTYTTSALPAAQATPSGWPAY